VGLTWKSILGVFLIFAYLFVGSIEMPDVEPHTVGLWDDTQLEAIDTLIVESQSRGVCISTTSSILLRLIISC
jgi:hypothetical protein